MLLDTTLLDAMLDAMLNAMLDATMLDATLLDATLLDAMLDAALSAAQYATLDATHDAPTPRASYIPSYIPSEAHAGSVEASVPWRGAVAVVCVVSVQACSATQCHAVSGRRALNGVGGRVRATPSVGTGQ